MQNRSPPGEKNAGGCCGVAPMDEASSLAVAASSTWTSRWQPAGPAPRRCTRKNASPFSGTSVANSPDDPLVGDKVDLVSSCQNEQAAAKPSDGRSMKAVSQRTATSPGYDVTAVRSKA